jgi:hypothetical protein
VWQVDHELRQDSCRGESGLVGRLDAAVERVNKLVGGRGIGL